METLTSGIAHIALSDTAAQVVTEVTDALTMAFEGAEVVALDVEGVDLSRKGRISIVQLASAADKCFLLDVLDKDSTDPLVEWLGQLLGDEGVVKIIHDCRMDADALHHHLGVNLVNVHDTSCWHAELVSVGTELSNMNDTLIANGLAPNQSRNTSVYRDKPDFWATRPMTPTMIQWASGDVSSMFDLYIKQVEGATSLTSAGRSRVATMTDDYFSWKTAQVEFVTVVRDVGRFIGPRGSNIRALQRRTNTIIYKAPSSAPGYTRNMFMVYYRKEESLNSVKRMAGQ